MDVIANRHQWGHLDHLQLGKFAEYFVKMEFTRLGLHVYSPEIDDRGVDLVIRNETGNYFEVQVKSCRDFNYIFATKEKCPLSASRLLAVVLFLENEAPKLYLVPTVTWHSPNEVFVSRDYEGKASKPDWGINLSIKNLPMLDPFRFDVVAETLRGPKNAIGAQQSSPSD